MTTTSFTTTPFLAGPGQPAYPARPLGHGRQPSLRVRFWSMVVAAYRRHRSRQLLARLDANMLKDIGVTFAEAEHEVNKPFWAR
jgi:uncharacterized protein YjiS (DUF1127 family)